MKYVDIDSIEVGQVLGEDIYDDFGNLLASCKTVISEDLLQRMKRLDLSLVVISEEVFPIISDEERAYITNLLLETISRIHFFGRRNFAKIKLVAYSEINNIISKNDKALKILSNLSDISEYTIMHSIRCAIISGHIAELQELPPEKQKKAIICGLFSQAGKLAVSKALLLKKGKLSEEELIEVRTFVTKTPQIIKGLDFIDNEILTGIMQANERSDGSGYPYGLKDEQIHPLAKIVAVANVFDAAISKKVYSDPVSLFEIASQLQSAAYDKLSPSVTTPLIKAIESCYPGMKIVLSDGREGEIVFMNKFDPRRPLVKVGDELIDLSMGNTRLTIISMKEESL